MTDEASGGKPRPFDKMRAGLLEALEYAKTDPMTHVTIPTAALTELLAAADECAEDLDGHISDRWPYADRSPAPPIIRQTVRRLRAAVARVRGE